MKLLPSFAVFLCLALGPAVSLRAQTPAPAAAAAETKTAIFAGGCFWCMQYAFDRVKGVKKTVVGYTGGTQDSPTYEDVLPGRPATPNPSRSPTTPP